MDLTGVTIVSGDTLTLSAYFKGNATTAKTQVVLRVTLAGNSTPVISKITVKRNAAYTLISLPTLQITGVVEQVRITFKHKSEAGKVWIDDVSLVHAPAGGRNTGVLLPSRTDGFRGGN